jgi:3-hydroxyisobutyrate dehydrogenase-like beta-hydroxyacid dehydrogenase
MKLPAAGLETTVFDIAAEPVKELVAGGAKAASSAREVAAASDVVGVCVQTDEQVRSVVLGEDGLLAGAKPGLAIAIHSTVSPATVQFLSELAAKQGVVVLDASVSGNTRAADPMFKLFVGGEAEQVAKIRPYLEAIAADRVIHAGALGRGSTAKICLNLITYLQWTAAFEANLLARAAGLSQEMLEQVGAVQRPAHRHDDLVPRAVQAARGRAEERRDAALPANSAAQRREGPRPRAPARARVRAWRVPGAGAGLPDHGAHLHHRGSREAVDQAVEPPSIGTTAPVAELASEEARKTIARATSSGGEIFGLRWSIDSATCGSQSSAGLDALGDVGDHGAGTDAVDRARCAARARPRARVVSITSPPFAAA